MSQEEWDDEKRRCSILTSDRRRRCLASDAKKAEEAADLRRAPGSSASHVTDVTGLPRNLFDSESAHHVFGITSGATMEDDDVSFPLNHGMCTYNRYNRAPRAKDEAFGCFA
jgi:hypothetical protein